MSRLNCEIYVHTVWHTKNDKPLLVGELEEFVHRRTREIAAELGLHAFAVNSAWTHTHGLLGWNSTESFDDAIRTIKSKITVGWTQRCRSMGINNEFSWQGGGSLYSIRKEDIPRILSYIANQKRIHADLRPDNVYDWQDGGDD